MKKLLLILILFMVVSCQKSDYRKVKQYTIEQFENTTKLIGSSFSFDEKNILFTSDESGVYNVYYLSIETNEVTQLTASDSNSIYSLSYFPNDDRFLFDSDKGGNEIWQIYVQNEDGHRDQANKCSAYPTLHTCPQHCACYPAKLGRRLFYLLTIS